MKITKIETLTCSSYRVMIWVRIHTDDGRVGTGDTCYYEEGVARWVHGVAAPYLIGKDPRQVELHHRTLRRRVEFGGHIAESNGLSAVDIALWDLFGQIVELPVSHLLGGPVRDKIRVYNTCHGSTHAFHWQPLRQPPDPNDYSARWMRKTGWDEAEFMWREQGKTGELAKSLLDMGINAMKIWPFDPHRVGSDGQSISQEGIETGMKPFRDVRDAVGMKMDLPVELHGGWYVQSAIRIAEALEEVRPLWIEDPLFHRRNIDGMAQIARKTRIPVAISETYSGRAIFKEALEKEAVGIVIVDIGWVGGITEAHFIAQLAQSFDRPVATHDASGPVTFVASSHFCVAEPNAMIMEGIRNSYIGGWFEDVLTAVPSFDNGYASPPPGPGLGTALRTEFLERPDVSRRVTES